MLFEFFQSSAAISQFSLMMAKVSKNISNRGFLSLQVVSTRSQRVIRDADWLAHLRRLRLAPATWRYYHFYSHPHCWKTCGSCERREKFEFCADFFEN